MIVLKKGRIAMSETTNTPAVKGGKGLTIAIAVAAVVTVLGIVLWGMQLRSW